LSPILGIIASQNYPRITNSYESIATVTVGTAQSTITFSSIPATYKHLQIRVLSRSTSTPGTIDNYLLRFNSDSSSVYATHRLDANGSVAYAQAYVPGSEISNYFSPNASTAANIFGAAIFDILDYADTNKFKTVRQLGGVDLNGSGTMAFDSGLWRSTTAINSVSFTLGSGNHAQYSSFALYGIK